MLERIYCTIGGAFLGALIGLGLALWWIEPFSWVPIAICSIIGAALAFLMGQTGIEWLKEIFWWS